MSHESNKNGIEVFFVVVPYPSSQAVVRHSRALCINEKHLKIALQSNYGMMGWVFVCGLLCANNEKQMRIEW